MSYVLITVTSGIIGEAIFYDDVSMAIQALAEYVKSINYEKDDAAIFGPEGFVANAKVFLDENDQYIDNVQEVLANKGKNEEPIFIIGNPHHRLGFMVASPDDPLGYKDPAEALSDLGQMRKDHGTHLKLFRVEPVSGPVLERTRFEQYNVDQVIEDFECSLVNEYLK